MLFFTNRALGHFRGGGSLSETLLFQTAGNNFCGQSKDKFWHYLWVPLLVISNFANCFLGIFSRCCFVNCCFLQIEPLGTLEEEVLCLRLDSFKTAGNNFCGRSEDKFWRYLSLLLRHFCSGYYCTLAAKAIWDQNPFEITFEFSYSIYCRYLFYTFYQNERSKNLREFES